MKNWIRFLPDTKAPLENIFEMRVIPNGIEPFVTLSHYEPP